MLIKLPFDIEINITVMTKRQRVLQDVAMFGTIRAVNRYIGRHECGLKEASNYFKKIRQWPETK